MPGNGAQDPGNEPQNGAQGPAQEPTDWQAQAAEWEKRAKGWQRELQSLQKEVQPLKDSEAQLKQSVADWESKYGALEGERGVLDQQLDELTGEMEKLTSAFEEKDSALQKLGLIRDEFPRLLKFSEMIPTLPEEEEQRNTLQEWSETLTAEIDTLANERVELALKGISPPASPPQGPQVPSEEELARIIEETAGVPGREKDYDKAYKQWEQLTTT